MEASTAPTRLYPRGAYLCVTNQSSRGTLLMCKTCTVVTTTSIMVPVIWLKQTDQAGVFRHSFRSDVLISSIIGEVVVTEKGKTVVLDMSEMTRLECLVKKLENEGEGERMESKGMVVSEVREESKKKMDGECVEEKMVSDDLKISESRDKLKRHCKKGNETVDTEPYIVEMVNTKMILKQLDATVDRVGRNMFTSFVSFEDMTTFTKLVEKETIFVPRTAEKEMKGRILPKTLSNASPAVPGEKSVLHMKVEENGDDELKEENLYELVTDIVEELLGGVGENIDTVEKQSEVEETLVPQIWKDQTYVTELIEINVEVTANLQFVVEDNSKDEKVNILNIIGEEENVESSDCNKRKAMKCCSSLVGEEEQTYKKMKLAAMAGNITKDDPTVLDREEDCGDLTVLHMEVADNVEHMVNQYDLILDIMEELLDRLWEDIDTVEKSGSGEDDLVEQLDRAQNYGPEFEEVDVIDKVEDNLIDEIASSPDPVENEGEPPANRAEKAADMSGQNRSPNYPVLNINNIEKLKSMKEEKEKEQVEKVDTSSNATTWSKRPNYLFSTTNNNVKDYTSHRMREGKPLVKKEKRRKAVRCLSCEPCMRADCGQCVRCQDMTKFGGRGRLKKACLGRVCNQMEAAPSTKL